MYTRVYSICIQQKRLNKATCTRCMENVDLKFHEDLAKMDPTFYLKLP